ncbi:alpha-L-rhamnosidase [Christensenella minuta]|uniref:alpha-L-rhamnosidase n=1 Tax=Christensenella minuta TaxID=626937 RepID=UPI002A82F72C|nr:family 78 glycoside hydrolase catalytic domain [Christensenella minuta]MDY3751949.1 family 78 glycoside hydrolase catalytic domain [Christensenella minuta]
MKVTDVKINGIVNPVGFALPDVSVSWRVADAADQKQESAEILVAADAHMERILARKQGRLDCAGEEIKLTLAPRTVYYVQVKVTGNGGETGESGVAFFETGKMNEPWSAQWIGQQPGDTFHPVFEKRVRVAGPLGKARLYICGLGLYEAYIGGRKVGDELLTPFVNEYRYALQAQTYDVTDMLRGDAVLSVLLGNGWYKGRLGYDGRREIYGDRFALIAELVLEYTDGTVETVATDESWTYRGSEIEYSDIYDGEGINRLLYEGGKNESRPAAPADIDMRLLQDRRSLPVKAMQEVGVREVIRTPRGEAVLDFGQNFAGYVTFHAAFPKGTKVVLRHGEILQEGCFYNENYRTAKSEFSYTSDGREEWVRPHFTFMGFRYVCVEGWPGELRKEDFVGKAVYSQMQRTGYLETDNPDLNQLAENALWGMKSNFLDMPTDCPQRDERLGWTGDAQVFAPTASFFMDTRAFYDKYLWDLHNDQRAHDGAVAYYLPNINNTPGGSSVWGDAATFIPDALYDIFGSERVLREHYPLMKDWVDWITKKDCEREGGPKRLFDFAFTFGDWLAMDGMTPQSVKGGTDDAYISSVYYYASVRKLGKAAGLLGKEEDAKRYAALAEQVLAAILREYFSPSGRLCVDTQTGYIIALHFGVYRDKEKIIRGLRERLKKDGYRIKCGFTGAPLICETLAENGMERWAQYLLLQDGFPGWMHCIRLGATTIWERWNSVLDDGSISSTSMNSLNHYSYGSVIHYVVRDIVGIKPLAPGYSRVRIDPRPSREIRKAKCSYLSARGEYRVEWAAKEDGSVDLKVLVPFDCEAWVQLPDRELVLAAGETKVNYRPACDFRRLYDWETLLEACRKDDRAMAVLKEKLPDAYARASGGDPEDLSLSLQDLRGMSWAGFRAEDVEAAAEALFALEA